MMMVEAGIDAGPDLLLCVDLVQGQPEEDRSLPRDRPAPGAAEGLTEAQAVALAREGKPLVHIDGGCIRRKSPARNTRCCSRTICWRSRTIRNRPHPRQRHPDAVADDQPDGHQMVADWYEERRHAERNPPRLYQEYVGHDNNRDAMLNMIESRLVGTPGASGNRR